MGAPAELVEELWELIDGGGRLVDVMNRLVAYGMNSVPDLAVVDGSRVLLRGQASADWGTGRTDAAGALTWQEWALPGREVEVRIDESAQPSWWPLLSGVVRADGFIAKLRSGTDSTVQDRPADTDSLIPGRATDPPPPVPDPAQVEVTVEEEGPGQSRDPGEAADATGVASAVVGPVGPLDQVLPPRLSDATLSGADLGELPPRPGSNAAATELAQPDDDVDPSDEEDSYDRLFGATAFVGAGASDRTPQVELPVNPASGSAITDLVVGPDEPAIPAAPNVSATPGAEVPGEVEDARLDTPVTGMISSVPLGRVTDDRAAKTLFEPAAQGSAARPLSPAPAPQSSARHRAPTDPSPGPHSDDVDDDSGLTVSREALASLRVKSTPGVQVPAVACPAGHLNPPEQVTCRVCGIEVPAQPAVTSPRPDLGALVLAKGADGVPERIPLTGSLIIGRRPHVDTVGNSVPRLVEIPSPDKDLSRNHLRVSVEGWHVVVCDLGSTNGTVVQLPGDKPQRLHESRPVVISPDSRIELAEVITYIYQVAR